MLTIDYRRNARAEYSDAVLWYEEQKSGLGIEFESEVEKVLAVISKSPNRYPIAKKDVREAIVHRFPYSVYYRQRLGRIVVLSVFHQARDPIEWMSRV